MDENERKKILDESLRRYLVMQGVLRKGDPLPKSTPEGRKKVRDFLRDQYGKGTKSSQTDE